MEDKIVGMKNSSIPYYGEEGYAEWMQQEVEPYLEKYCREGTFLGEGNISIHYCGYKLKNADKCVVISHGFCECAEKYCELIYYFLQAGISMYIMEHRGHGHSGRLVDNLEMIHVEDFKDYAKDLIHFVKDVVKPQEEHVYLLGHSMGGAISLLTLEEEPNLFEAAILSSPMCGINTGKYSPVLLEIIAGVGCLLGKRKSFALGQTGFKEKPKFEGSSSLSEARYMYFFQKRLQNQNYRTHGGSFAWVYESMKACRIMMKPRNLEKIDTPILLFMAGKEHMVDNARIEVLAKSTKHTKFVVMSDSRHEIFNAKEETRRSYYEEIFNFLNSI